jgi:hypothetical protein
LLGSFCQTGGKELIFELTAADVIELVVGDQGATSDYYGGGTFILANTEQAGGAAGFGAGPIESVYRT